MAKPEKQQRKDLAIQMAIVKKHKIKLQKDLDNMTDIEKYDYEISKLKSYLRLCEYDLNNFPKSSAIQNKIYHYTIQLNDWEKKKSDAQIK